MGTPKCEESGCFLQESSGPFAHTVSLFRDGLRASEPQPLPEHLRNKPLFPHAPWPLACGVCVCVFFLKASIGSFILFVYIYIYRFYDSVFI